MNNSGVSKHERDLTKERSADIGASTIFMGKGTSTVFVCLAKYVVMS